MSQRHATHRAAGEKRAFELPPYTPEMALAAGAYAAAAPVDNGGTRALRELERANARAPQKPGHAGWDTFVRATLVRTTAHLRNAGVGYVYDSKQATVTLTGVGPHPYNALVRELADERIALKLAADVAAEAEAAVLPGERAIYLGFALILELDPQSPAIAHERFHVHTPKKLGASPHAGAWLARKPGRAPGPPHWDYPIGNADEPGAYCAGIAARFTKLAAMIRENSQALPRELHEMRGETMFALQVTLRTIAIDKQSISAINSRNFVLHDTLSHRVLELQQDKPARGDFSPYAYRVAMRRGMLDVLLTGVDMYFARRGEASWITRGRLRGHFEWQLRASQEHLAMLRVTAQALDALGDTPDAALCERMALLLQSGRTGASRSARGISYDEALATANVDG